MALQAADPLPGPTAYADAKAATPPFGRWGQLVLDRHLHGDDRQPIARSI